MNTKDLKSVIKRKFDHDAAKKILAEKYEAKMLFVAYEGMWKSSPELLNLLTQFLDKNEIVILDSYGNPCKVSPKNLYEQAKERWQEQMNGWFVEYRELETKR